MPTYRRFQAYFRIPSWIVVKRANIAFVTTLLVGFALITLIYVDAGCGTIPPEIVRLERQKESTQIADRQKTLVQAQGDASKWLLGLASGALIGFITLRMKDRSDERLIESAPMTAYALLVLSIYGSYLVSDSTLQIMTRRPIECLYGNFFRFPLLIQFWTLFAAVMLLGGWLLRPNSSRLAICVLMFFFIPSAGMSANDDRQKCVDHWIEDHRFSRRPAAGFVPMIIQGIENKSQVQLPNSCTAVESLLDQVRANSANQDEFYQRLNNLHDELAHPDASYGTVVAKLVKFMDIFNYSFGVLRIVTKQDDFKVFLGGDDTGFAPWVDPLRPGRYRIIIKKGTKEVYANDSFEIVADREQVIDLDNLKK